MQAADRPDFDVAMNRLCASANAPPTQARRDAYFDAFKKITLLEFTGLVDIATRSPDYPDMPTTGQLWALHERVQSQNRPAPAQVFGPTLQEQLLAWITRRMGVAVTTVKTPTFLYREWVDASRPRGQQNCAECVGWMAELPDGGRVQFEVAEMHAPEWDRGAAA